MIARPALASLFARLERAGADTRALAGVALPDTLLALPQRVLAGFTDDGWQRVAQAVARTEGAAPEAPAAEPAAARAAPRIARAPVRPPVARPAHESTRRDGFALPDGEEVSFARASASTRASSPIAPVHDREDDTRGGVGRAASDDAESVAGPRAAQRSQLVEATALPAALRWQPAPALPLARAELAAWAEAGPAADAARAAPADAGAGTPARPSATSAADDLPAAFRRAATAARPDAMGTAPRRPDAEPPVAWPRSVEVPETRLAPSTRSPSAGSASQLGRLVELWQSDATPMGPPPVADEAPATAPWPEPASASALPAWRADASADPATAPPAELVELVEQLLVDAVERDGLSVEGP